MDDLKNKVIESINLITQRHVNVLTNEWQKMYNADLAKTNLEKIVNHIDTFYCEIVDETKARKLKILKTIDQLRMEQENLKRALNADADINIRDDVPLYTYQEHLDLSLENLREQLKVKRDQINRLLQTQTELCNELGEPEKNFAADDLLPSESDVEDFKGHLGNLKLMKQQRVNSIIELRKNIIELTSELDMELSESLASLLENPSLKLVTVKRLEQYQTTLIKKKVYFRDTIENIKAKLVELWECLEIAPPIRVQFMSCSTFTEKTLNILQEELNRCEALKRQNMKKFVERIREEILIFWDKTMKSDQERARFIYFTSDVYTEDLLGLHEMELNDLKTFYEKNRAIFAKYEEHKTLWDNLIALEAKENEPGRLNNRGGQLLKEERERKQINSKLPKLRNEITELTTQYEEIHKRKFMIWGQDIEEIIDADYKNRQIVKEQQMSARKAVKDNGAGQSTFRTPMSTTKIGSSVSTVKRVASTTNLFGSASAKKPKMQESTVVATGVKAKRNLLGDYNKANAKKTPYKSPLKRVIATLIEPKRRSYRRSGNNKNTQKHPLPQIEVTEASMVSYDQFESHISTNTPCRSSEINKNISSAVTRSKTTTKPQTPGRIQAATNLRMVGNGTPVYTIGRTQTPANSTMRSPKGTSIMINGKPMLATKNIQIAL